MKQFKISAKNLAQLNIANSCRRCFWHLIRLRHKVPFNIFPGIFSSFDHIQKKLIEESLADGGNFPAWLGSFAQASGIAETPARMEHVDAGTNIVLVGIPDHVYEWSDASVSPIDYKTARHSRGQDALRPLYQGQLDAYAFLLEEECDLESERGALVYFEPNGDTVTLTKDGFTQPWLASVVETDVSGARTSELLSTARDIYDLDIPPDGRAECPDCELLDNVVAVARKQQKRSYDSLRYMTWQEKQRHLANLQFQENHRRTPSVGASVIGDGSTQSLLTAWDWNI